jgi:hypothetical protein
MQDCWGLRICRSGEFWITEAFQEVFEGGNRRVVVVEVQGQSLNKVQTGFAWQLKMSFPAIQGVWKDLYEGTFRSP